MKIVIAIVMIIVLTSCGGSQPIIKTISPEEGKQIVLYKISNYIYRFHDDEAHATCWIYGSNGISCIPDRNLER